MDTKQAANLWNTSMGEVAKYCQHGFVEEAKKVGRKWQIPNNAIRPLYFKPSNGPLSRMMRSGPTFLSL